MTPTPDSKQEMKTWQERFRDRFNELAVFVDGKKEYYAVILPKDRHNKDEYALGAVEKFIEAEIALAHSSGVEEERNRIASLIDFEMEDVCLTSGCVSNAEDFIKSLEKE